MSKGNRKIEMVVGVAAAAIAGASASVTGLALPSSPVPQVAVLPSASIASLAPIPGDSPLAHAVRRATRGSDPAAAPAHDSSFS